MKGAHSQNNANLLTIVKEYSDGLVVILPCAVVFATAATIWSFDFEALIEFMVTHVTNSPTESAAAAILAVILAFKSSASAAITGNSEAQVSQTVGTYLSPSDSLKLLSLESVYENVKGTSDSVMETLSGFGQYYPSDVINSQCATSMEYLKSTIQQLPQNLIQQLDTSTNHLQSAASLSSPRLLRSDSSCSGDGQRTEGLAYHQYLQKLFMDCMPFTELPSKECIHKLFDANLGGAQSSYAGGKCEWQKLFGRSSKTMNYSAWSMPLRKGLNVYKTRTIFYNASMEDYLDFMTDDQYRNRWDDTVCKWVSKADGSSPHSNSESPRSLTRRALKDMSGTMQIDDVHCKVRLPPPFASRQYQLQRSVWKAKDRGTIICVAKSPGEDFNPSERVVNVYDYLSCCSAQTIVDRATKKRAVEVNYIYFEDTRLPPAIINHIVRCKMAPYLLKTEKAMRYHVEHVKRKEGGRQPRGFLSENRKLNKNKGVGRLLSVATLGLMMGTKWTVPLILSELTRQVK